MDYGQIVNRAYQLVRTNSVFWKLGLLAMFAQGVGGGFGGWSMPGPMDDPTPSTNGADQAFTWLSNNIGLVVSVIVVLVLIGIILWTLGLRATSGIIHGVEAAETNKPIGSFKDLFGQGKQSLWRLVGLHLLAGIVLVILVGIMILGFLGPILSDSLNPQLALLSLFIFLPIFIVVSIYLAFVMQIAIRSVVLDNTRIGAAIACAHEILFKQFGRSIVSLIISFGLGILYGFVIIAVLFLSAGIGALLAVLFGAISKVLAGVVIGLLAVAILGVLIWISGWFASFQATYWTLVYRALRHLHQK